MIRYFARLATCRSRRSPARSAIASAICGTILLVVGIPSARSAEPAAAPRTDSAAEAAYAARRTELEALERDEKFEAAQAAASKHLAETAAAFGPDNWRTASARLEAAHASALQSLPSDKRTDLARARSLLDEASRADGGEQRLVLARQAADLRRTVLGERDLETLDARSQVGKSLQGLSRFDEAETVYVRNRDVIADLVGRTHPSYADSLFLLATLREDQSRYDEALQLGDEVVSVLEKTVGVEQPFYAQVVRFLGNVQFDRRKFELAERQYRRALEIYGRLGAQRQIAHTQSNLANALQMQGKYRDAEPCYREALAALRKVDPVEGADSAIVLRNLADLYERLQDYARAEESFRAAMSILKRSGGENDAACGSVLQQLAWLLSQEGNFSEARQCVEEACRLIEIASGNRNWRYARALNTWGEIERRRRDFAAAESLFRRAAAIVEKGSGDDRLDLATYVQNLALAHDEQADYPTADREYQRALEIIRTTHGERSFSHALLLNNIGYLRTHQGRAAEAEKLYLEALEIYAATVGPNDYEVARTQMNLGELKRAAGAAAEADRHFRRALDLQIHLRDSAAGGQSESRQLAMEADLREYLDDYLSLAVEYPAARTSAYDYALRWKGSVFMRRRSQRALANRPDLAPLAERLRDTTQQLAHLALDFVDDSGAASPKLTGSNNAPSAADDRRRRIDALWAEQQSLQRELALKSEAYRESQAPLDAAALRGDLPPGAVLVDYWEYDHRLFPSAGNNGPSTLERRVAAFVLDHDRAPEFVPLGPAEPIRTAVAAWRKDYGASSAGRAAGVELRSRLWDPLEGKLSGAKFVLMSPDGAAASVPFAALPARAGDRYLIEDWAIAVVPVPQSIPVLLRPRDRAAEGNLLLVGDIDYDAVASSAAPAQPKKTFGTRRAARFGGGAVFMPLEFTRDEIASLERDYEQDFGKDGLAILRRSEADEAAFRKHVPNYRYVHVATHGFFAPPELRSALAGIGSNRSATAAGDDLTGLSPGLLSGLALAGANHPFADGDDGILTAEEAALLDLDRVDLLVLSACETGLGEVAGGEGLLGLQRAFQIAGTRSVVAAMWKVSDRETRDLMERFYSNLWDKQMDMLGALREAQLWMMRSGPKRDIRLGPPQAPGPDARSVSPPYYWAPFVLSGDWR